MPTRSRDAYACQRHWAVMAIIALAIGAVVTVAGNGLACAVVAIFALLAVPVTPRGGPAWPHESLRQEALRLRSQA